MHRSNCVKIEAAKFNVNIQMSKNPMLKEGFIEESLLWSTKFSADTKELCVSKSASKMPNLPLPPQLCTNNGSCLVINLGRWVLNGYFFQLAHFSQDMKHTISAR
jgi:hypothetical protein